MHREHKDRVQTLAPVFTPPRVCHSDHGGAIEGCLQRGTVCVHLRRIGVCCIYARAPVRRSMHAWDASTTNPIKFVHRQKVPARIKGRDRYLIDSSHTITYDDVTEHDLTMEELYRMGADIIQVVFSWGKSPSLDNLLFTGSSLEMLSKVSRFLQSNVGKRLFHAVCWFDIGLTIEDMINLKPDIRLLMSFGVTFQKLMENDAFLCGVTWNVIFKWSKNDWGKIGYSEVALKAHIQKLNRNGAPVDTALFLQWGPLSKTV